MTKAAPLVLSPDRRKHPRVHFSRRVKLIAGDHAKGRFPTRNLSLCGLFIEGAFDLPIGAPCHLELHETNKHVSLLFPFTGKVLRHETDGIGIEFTAMQEESFMFLQTMILYSSDDPVDVAQDFQEDFVPGSKSFC